jgi:cephalosporin hydroxylase
MMAKNHHTG